MRSIVCIMLLVPALVLAGNMQPVTALPTETGIATGPAVGKAASTTPGRASFTLGAVDTIGGTTYDWGANGPALRMLVNSPGYGVHAIFMYSASTSGTTFPDRNIRYNYYDYATRAWSWVDPDFMQSGVNTFTDRTGYGALDQDPTTGVAVVSAHHTSTGSNLAPVVARDIAAGAGVFEYAPGEATIDQHAWPWVQFGTNGTYHLAMIDNVSQDYLRYSRCTTWPDWETYTAIPDPQPEPAFPDHNIAVSKSSGNTDVCLTWVQTLSAYGV
jgi:hypothetical protein